jgi:transposase InsO family protein
MSTVKEKSGWKDEVALERHRMIAPLLDETLDPSKRQQLRNKQAEMFGISTRSLFRYEAAYRENGFEGLRPKTQDKRSSKRRIENFDEVLAEAIQLKREVPTRSISQIIIILELEGYVESGTLHRSTLQRHMFEAGYGKKQMQKYVEAKATSSARFVKPHRMMLLQADIKYGIKLPLGKNGKLVQTYLSAVIDDHSRFVVGSEFYDNQEAGIVEDTFRKVILNHGTFDAAYCDNGGQYISHQLEKTFAMLGIRRIRHKPFVPRSKGKIEKFNQLVDGFLAEVKIARIKTLKELNQNWNVWLEMYYHNKPHSALGENITPLMAWNRDSRLLKFLDASRVAEAFLHHDTRVVDKAGCISFKSKKYEVGLSLIGATVDISYDPVNHERITVRYKDMDPIESKPLEIGEICKRSPKIPERLLPVEPSTSRLLDGLKKKQDQMQKMTTNAISFDTYLRGGAQNV